LTGPRSFTLSPCQQPGPARSRTPLPTRPRFRQNRSLSSLLRTRSQERQSSTRSPEAALLESQPSSVTTRHLACWTSQASWEYLRLGVHVMVLCTTLGSSAHSSHELCARRRTQSAFGLLQQLSSMPPSALTDGWTKPSIRQVNPEASDTWSGLIFWFVRRVERIRATGMRACTMHHFGWSPISSVQVVPLGAMSIRADGQLNRSITISLVKTLNERFESRLSCTERPNDTNGNEPPNRKTGRSRPRTWCIEPSRGGTRGGVGGSGVHRVILIEKASSARSHHDGHHLPLWISSRSCASTWRKPTPTCCARSSRPSSRRSWAPRSMRSAALPTTMRAPSASIGATGSAAVLRATRLGTQVIWPNSCR